MPTSNGKAEREARTCWLHLDGWAGRTQQLVKYEGVSTDDKAWIRAITPTRLAGRRRLLQPGKAVKVPKYAISMEQMQGVEVVD